MKNFLLAIVLVLPIQVLAADCNNDSFTTRILEADGTEKVIKESKTYCKDGSKTVFDECELYQWRHRWGAGTSVSCNWNERKAIETALTHAPDGFKVEWYDNKNDTKGFAVVSWSRPLSNAGWCRDIVVAKYRSSSIDRSNYIMCWGQDQKWQVYKGY